MRYPYFQSFLVTFLVVLSSLAYSQEKPKLFINCQEARCYETFLRTELTYFTFSRDQSLADVQIFITDQTNAGGGRNYQINFIGQNNYDSTNYFLEFETRQDDTESIARTKILNKINQGILLFLAKTNSFEDVQVSYPKGQPVKEREKVLSKDPWNGWIFGLDATGLISGESNKSRTRLAGSFRGGRTTYKSKYSFYTYYNNNRNSVTVDNIEETVKVNSYGFNSIFVTSFSKNWSIGGFVKSYHSVYSNINLSSSIAPAIEFSIFPIENFNKEQFRWIYQAGYRRLDYLSPTIFDQTLETRPYHQLTSILGYTKPWGNFSAELNGYQYLNDTEKYRVSLELDFRWRIGKGISLRFDGSIAQIKDQISLAKTNVSSEELLLGGQQLPTSFDFFSSFGLNYTFGSANGSIVNPRFSGVN
ncbi:hypothetical protein SAMN06298216_4029 [Spirosomataceae bacterium TFI 002]|nr:hypothetical protein SAMN06298216_4029 [Spirosomataceae bacterium TFI 002]